jgi:hypothetical protein
MPKREKRSQPAIFPGLKEFSGDSDSMSFKDLSDYYRNNQICLVRNARGKDWKRTFGVDDLRKLYESEPSIVEKSFCVENSSGEISHLNAKTCFGSVTEQVEMSNAMIKTKDVEANWYCSFIAQKVDGKGSKAMLELESKLPLRSFGEIKGISELSLSLRSTHKTTAPIWIFVGVPDPSRAMPGRKEHIDSIQHDGTWHLQVSGAKTWKLRPAESQEWNGVDSGCAPQLAPGCRHLEVTLREGDFLAVNTRLWWHSTIVEPGEVCFSYARDFYDSTLSPSSSRCSSAQNKEILEDREFTNVEGVYATRDLNEGDVVLSEHELPDCSLGRSNEPNCEVGESEDGILVLVAIKNIHTGDWLTVAESSDEESEEEGDDDDDD